MSDEGLIQAVNEECMKLAVQYKFNSLEKPKRIVLLWDPFTIENDFLTPTMKLKRNIAAKAFDAEIKAEYAKGPMKK